MKHYAKGKSLLNVVKSKVFVYQKQMVGFPKPTDFKLIEVELPPLQEGEFLAQAVYLSIDPYMRGYARNTKLGTTAIGSQVAKIIESKNNNFPVGKYVLGSFGWRTHTISKGNEEVMNTRTYLIPDLGNLPLSLALGVLGMPGNTAYFGFLEICQPKAGETIVVSGAAGAVGSLVGQIAKIKGCKAIGIAGSDEKGKWLTEKLKFDHFINYKTQNIKETLRKLAPQGVDCYFDNVGGEISSTVISRMNKFGRISVCGCISNYNDVTPEKTTALQAPIIQNELKMEGFVVTRWNDRWFEGITQMKKWIDEGKIVYEETVTEGFDNMFEAFVNMLKGGNTGKAIVKV